MHQHHLNPQEQWIPIEDRSQQNPFSNKSSRERESRRRYQQNFNDRPLHKRSFREDDTKDRKCIQRKNGLQDSGYTQSQPHQSETEKRESRYEQLHITLTRLGNTEKSRIAQHGWEEQHQMHWDQAKIIVKEQGWKKRIPKEAAFMAITPNCINKYAFSSNKDLWMPIIRKHLKRSAGGNTHTPSNPT
ncbi:hypothetical protein NQ315_014564 [Exocentrus adspersus]|uniref:Uncharacterized protein n=1 Tax=Exocentrus adspersus TaxID=1586481 RepID=A0AAV8VKP2_9CUCU|nr:hypothetical protein NQ315_014564 [Exocentrus adspersus]